MSIPNAAHAGAWSDTDADLVPDMFDNCRTVANGPNQLLGINQSDSDGDGYGNRCDTDFDQSGTTTTADFGRFLAAFGGSFCVALFPPPPACLVDLDGSGTITTADFGIFLGRFSNPPGMPGPTGLACARYSIRIDLGDVPCAP
ncbi:MAG: thrombospondin type 3 repeat-containing protein [Myxococcota bacterium]